MLEVEGACELVSSGGTCGGVWKKVRSKEKARRCKCRRRKLGKNKKKRKKYILLGRCTGQKYPDPFLGLRPKHNSITARTRPHASLGPTWTSDLN